MSALPTAPSADWDLFSREVLATYFAAREHEVYFGSLKSQRDRRDFYPQLAGALTALLVFLDDPASVELLDSVVFRHRKKLGPVDRGSQILDYLRKTNPRGAELLALTPPVTFDSLQASYRSAAKKYHPDVGGSNEDMKTVNVAFEVFHEVISQWNESPTAGGRGEAPQDSVVGYFGFEIRSAVEYMGQLGAVLIAVQTDSWAVDKAYSVARLLGDHGLLSSGFAQQTEFAGSFARLLIKLAEKLHTAGLVDEAKATVRHSRPWIARAREGDHFPEGWRSSSTTLRTAQEEVETILNDELELKVVIMHPCQAENLFRLKVIDEKKYREVSARFETRRTQDESVESELARFRRREGFTQLSYDVPFRSEPGTTRLVPVPGYFWGRIDHLSGEQRAEYFCAFGPSGSPDSITQYLYTRASSYLCSLVHRFSAEEAERIERESEFLQKLFPGREEWFGTALRVSKYLRQLDPDTRKEKLGLLRKLDTSETPTIGIITIGAIDTHIRIAPTPYYLSAVRASAERLRMALQTGSIQTAAEQRNERADWSHDIDIIRRLDSNEITGRARDALWNHRNEPEIVGDALKPHIKQLLEAGKQIAAQNTGQLQLGYWIDGISAALVKLKRWNEAVHWLELFFGLDPHHQDRLAYSEKEKMLRRLVRCKAEIAK